MIAILGPDAPLWLVALLQWLDNLLRYMLVAAPTFLLFWVWGRERFSRFRIQPKWPKALHLRREVRLSMGTAVVFSLVGTVTYYATAHELTGIYTDLSTYGWAYVVLTVPIYIVLQDAWFYWTHRAMHHPLLYKHFHRAHHLSTNPSPWAAYAFSPGEALVHAIFVPLTSLVVPAHPIALGAFLVYMITRNVWGHLCLELLPRWFARHPLLGRHTTTTHHDLHHRRFTSNYGLYFTWWDRWMGTEHPDYLREFEKVTERARASARSQLQALAEQSS